MKIISDYGKFDKFRSLIQVCSCPPGGAQRSTDHHGFLQHIINSCSLFVYRKLIWRQFWTFLVQ